VVTPAATEAAIVAGTLTLALATSAPRIVRTVITVLVAAIFAGAYINVAREEHEE
jgi:hypothetical protein